MHGDDVVLLWLFGAHCFGTYTSTRCVRDCDAAEQLDMVAQTKSALLRVLCSGTILGQNRMGHDKFAGQERFFISKKTEFPLKTVFTVIYLWYWIAALVVKLQHCMDYHYHHQRLRVLVFFLVFLWNVQSEHTIIFHTLIYTLLE